MKYESIHVLCGVLRLNWCAKHVMRMVLR